MPSHDGAALQKEVVPGTAAQNAVRRGRSGSGAQLAARPGDEGHTLLQRDGCADSGWLCKSFRVNAHRKKFGPPSAGVYNRDLHMRPCSRGKDVKR
jgi:hypothetical protein